MKKAFLALALVGLTIGAFAQTTPAKKATAAKTVTKADTSKKAAKAKTAKAPVKK